MAKPGRLKEIEEEHGEALDTLIPRLLNELGTIEAVARHFNTSFETIYRWVKENNVEKRFVWEKAEPEHTNGSH